MKTWTASEIRDNLLKNDKWVSRAILALYNLQTPEEKKERKCLVPDGVGFDNADIATMSSFVAYFKKFKHFTPHQIFEARKRICKYLGQLVKLANETEKKKQFKSQRNPFQKHLY